MARSRGIPCLGSTDPGQLFLFKQREGPAVISSGIDFGTGGPIHLSLLALDPFSRTHCSVSRGNGNVHRFGPDQPGRINLPL